MSCHQSHDVTWISRGYIDKYWKLSTCTTYGKWLWRVVITIFMIVFTTFLFYTCVFVQRFVKFIKDMLFYDNLINSKNKFIIRTILFIYYIYV